MDRSIDMFGCLADFHKKWHQRTHPANDVELCTRMSQEVRINGLGPTYKWSILGL